MNSDADKIARNIAARRAVAELLELVPALDANKVSENRFWELLAEEAGSRCGLITVPDGPPMAGRPMSDEEAVRFEGETVPFGKHEGRRVGDVEPEYWIVIKESAFNKKLDRYIRSAHFRRLQED